MSISWSARTRSPNGSASGTLRLSTITRTTIRHSQSRSSLWAEARSVPKSGTGLRSSGGREARGGHRSSAGGDQRSQAPRRRWTGWSFVRVSTSPQPHRREQRAAQEHLAAERKGCALADSGGPSDGIGSSYRLLRRSSSSGVEREAATTVRTRWDERSTPSTWSALVRSRSGSAPEGRATSTGGGRTPRASRSPSPCWVAARAARPTSGTGPTSSAGPASEARSPRSLSPRSQPVSPVSAEKGRRPAPGPVLFASWWVIVMARAGQRRLDAGQLAGSGEIADLRGLRRVQTTHWWRKSDGDVPEPVALMAPAPADLPTSGSGQTFRLGSHDVEALAVADAQMTAAMGPCSGRAEGRA